MGIIKVKKGNFLEVLCEELDFEQLLDGREEIAFSLTYPNGDEIKRVYYYASNKRQFKDKFPEIGNPNSLTVSFLLRKDDGYAKKVTFQLVK